jgi:hypothetical protein
MTEDISKWENWRYWASQLPLERLEDWCSCDDSQIEYLMDGATEPTPQELRAYMEKLIEEKRREQETRQYVGKTYTFFGEHIWQQKLALDKKRSKRDADD